MATELRFPVEIDDGQAAKELDKLVNKMDKLKENIAKNESARAPIVEQLKEAQDAAVEAYNRVEELKAALAESEAKTSITGNADPGTYIAEIQRQTQIKAELAEQEKIMQAKEKEAQKLEAQDSKRLDVLAQQTAELEQAQERSGKLTEQITDATKGKNLKAIFEGTRAAVNSGVKSLLRYGIGIRTLFTLFSKLKTYTIEAVKAFAENDPDTQKSINELKASLQGLKGSWGAAFAPILNAVIPVLQTLVGWLTKAANAIAAFFAALSGRGSFKRAITDTGKLSDNLSSGAGAAKDMKKQLMGIDTLNVMSDNSDTGGGGGGSSSGLEYEDVQISDKLKNNLEAIKDIIVAIGAGIAGWGLGKVLTNLGLIKGGFKQLLGIALLVSGTVVAIKGGIDAWKNGIDWQNLIEMIGGVALAAGGAALAFGTIAAAITLLIGGIGMLVVGIHEWISTGELAHETGLLIAAGLLAIGIAISLLTQSWIPLIIAVVVAVALTIYNYWGEISGWFKKNVAEPLKQAIDSVKTWFADRISDIKNAFDGLKTKAADVKDALINKFENMRSALSGIVDRIKNLFNFQFQLPQLRLPHIKVQWQDAGALAQFFGLTKIPHLSVSWYARGGIVDGATLIGAGEAGKEAIVPLERNTQWVTMVANELADIMFDRMTDKFAGLNMRMPAVAGGFVAPPNAFSSGSYGGISPELESKLDALLDRLSGGNVGKIEPSDVYLDKRKVGEIMYTYTEERNRGRGK